MPRRRRHQLPSDTALIPWLRALRPGLRASALALLGDMELDSLDRDWPGWAHGGQEAPATDADGEAWRTWVLMAGRGFGKTLAGAKWIVEAIATEERLSIALVGATLDEARRVMVEGRSGLLNVADAWVTDWNPSLRRLKFRTGAEAVLFSGASPEQLRGPEHHLAWCDELAKWEKPEESWNMLQLGLRLGSHPRALVTTTPRPGPVLQRIMASPGCVVTGGRTHANPHLSRAWKAQVDALYAGTRLGRQELEGELLTDAPGQLWTPELIERCRIPLPAREGSGVGASQRRAAGGHAPPPASSGLRGDPPPTPPLQGGELSCPDQSTTLIRVLIAVDPPSGAGTCGIIACAKDARGIAHILADHSVTGLSPEGWARAVAAAAAAHGTKEVIAEKNQGGEMIRAVFATADPDLRVKLVTAKTGKTERATPVAHLFEAGKVVLHGHMPALEAELLGMIAGGDYERVWTGGAGEAGKSPDRADAMVWGVTELMLGKAKGQPQVRTL